MPSRYFYFPLIILGAIFFYLAETQTTWYAYLVIPVVVLLAVVYFSEPQINWWWWQRHPPDLPEGLRCLFEQHNSFYRGLTDERKRLFRSRIFLFSHNKAWKPQNWDAVPEDIKAMIASGAVTLYFQEERGFMTDNLENVVVYPGAFPSPNYPEDWHASETYSEDNVLLFSAEHVGRGFTRSQEYLDLSLYEFAKDYWLQPPHLPDFPQGAAAWALIQELSGFPEAGLRQFIGIPDISTDAILTTLFFTHSRNFASKASELFAELKNHFG